MLQSKWLNVRFKKNSLFLLIIILFLPSFGYAAPSSAYALQAIKTRRDKKRYASIAEAMFTHDEAQQDQFMTHNEWDELQMDAVHYQIDYTQTKLGHWQLAQFLHPIADVQTIQERQEVIKQLVHDSVFFEQAQKVMLRVVQCEDALISYWNPHDILSLKAEDYYFGLPWKLSSFNEGLNHSKRALDWSMAWKIIKRCDALFIEVCKVSLAREMVKWSLGLSPSLSLEGMLLNNAKSMLRAHLPFYWFYDSQKYKGSLPEYQKLMEEGSMGDRVAAFARGATYQKGSVAVFDDNSWFKNAFGSTFKYEYSDSKMLSMDEVPWYKLGAYGVASFGYTAYLDYCLYAGSKQSFDAIKHLFKIMDRMRIRLAEIAHAVQMIRLLESEIANHPTISNYEFAQKMQAIRAHNVSEKFEQLLKLLKKDTFKQETSLLHSRGDVLLAHTLMLEVKEELVPVLQAVAEFDAYVSAATLMVEHQDGDARFSFAEFVHNDTPIIECKDCWVPLIAPEKAVVNDIIFGIDDAPNKMVITGPNGGGKSTFLKAIGHSMSLIHGLGIAPASSARITPFAQLCTCLRPQESLLDDMSQFMAEKKRMDEVIDLVAASDADHKIIALIDEPFRGTVDAESAERIYDFGERVAQKEGSIVCVATHVKKPINLSRDIQGIFGNCFVQIAEHQDGTFERLFEVQQGIDHWWFDDASKRSRFIDWLSTQYAPSLD